MHEVREPPALGLRSCGGRTVLGIQSLTLPRVRGSNRPSVFQSRRETARQKENKSIFALLVAAGERLMRIIQKNRDCANKDIKKFTAEVNALCEK